MIPLDNHRQGRAAFRSTLMHLLAVAAFLTGAFLMATNPAAAQTLGDRVQLHGFGGWAAGDTDGNSYLGGEEGREYDTITFALAATAQVSEQLTISAQIFSEGEDEEIKTELEYAFAEWTFSDQLKLRAGLVKQPFGIYTEVFDVGTIRPFFDLPQGIYGPTEFQAQAYQGLGLTGRKELGGGWGLQYDVYGGEIGLDSTEASNPFLDFEDEAGEEDEDEDEGGAKEKLKDVLGGRLKFTVPGDKLSFGVSAYFGTPEEEEEAGEGDEDEVGPTHETYALNLEYLTSDWVMRLEYAHREGGDENVEGRGAYLEVARYFKDKWQIAARYDWAELEADNSDIIDSLLEHEDRAISLNYWFNANLVFKLSYHLVEGNLFAVPEDLDEGDELETETQLIQLGVQFSF